MLGGLLKLTALLLLALTTVQGKQQTCGPGTCKEGAFCTNSIVGPICACLPGFTGNPLTQCLKIPCTVYSECPMDQACVNQRCVNPCEGACGVKADCEVLNHLPICTCLPGYTGSPMSECMIADPGFIQSPNNAPVHAHPHHHNTY